ncbi:HDIG domain-containing protein [Verrucomicrobium sp. GAS474]|uniref:HD domain-containing phosphohydrolase n=1 Tax=Verrucomicrobium sp. GAS474 TaxID=1882831 RepID=UPI00087ACD69|nr:HD domain-containing phosphohydrolase [Verrucomicrobium sp. GAS474]SDU16872.1 HDIG domain-containing protein [Verrucomicrobium sp. GAS474]
MSVPAATEPLKHLLIVHDDRVVLDSLASYFRNIYSVAFCESATDAGVMIRQGFQPNVILTSHRYMNLKGDSFIEDARRMMPGVAVVYTVTGQQMNVLGLSTVLNGQDYMFLNLEWQIPEIIQAVRLAFQYYRLNTQAMGLRAKKSRESTVLDKVREENRISQRRMATETSELARNHFQMISILGELLGALTLGDIHQTNHALHTAYVAREIGRAMNLPKAEMMPLVVAALFHDVGKSAPSLSEKVSSSVLWPEPGRLTPVEQTVYERHVAEGVAILAKAGLPEKVRNLVEAHHERLDGSGFPKKLSGEQIPVGARIIAVADFFHNTAYRNTTETAGLTEAQRLDRALAQIRSREVFFGADIVAAFFAVADHLGTASTLSFEKELLEGDWTELFPEIAEIHARYEAAALAEQA